MEFQLKLLSGDVFNGPIFNGPSLVHLCCMLGAAGPIGRGFDVILILSENRMCNIYLLPP